MIMIKMPYRIVHKMPVESRMSKITVCKERRKLSISLGTFQRNIRPMVTLFLNF